MVRALIAVTVLHVSACSASVIRSDTDFWSEAEPPPLWEIDPPRALPADATLVFDEFDAIVADHGQGRIVGADFTLRLQSGDGSARALNYRIGAGRMLPVKSGDRIHLMMWQRRGAMLAGGGREVDGLGVVITAQWGAADEAQTTVAVVDVRRTVPPNAMPTILGVIMPTEVQVWQTAERTAQDCYIAEAHQQFVVGEAPRGRRTKPPMAPPGSRVRLWDGEQTYDVALLDNRRVLQTDCTPEPAPWWGWVALWTPEKGRTLSRDSERPRPSTPEGSRPPVPAGDRSRP